MRSYGYFVPNGAVPPVLAGGRRWLVARFCFEIAGSVAGNGKQSTPAPGGRVMNVVATDLDEMRRLVREKLDEIIEIAGQVREWQPGDRVVRQVFMDDGTWSREGDSCLARSPLRAGVVVERDKLRPAVYVKFDDAPAEVRLFLDHGLRAEA